MRRVVVLGRGGAGKSVLSARLGAALDLPVIELDSLFWRSPDLVPLSAAEWRRVQAKLVEEPAWVLDGDLGPYDVLGVRLAAADTVVLLDLPLAVCAWRALRRSRERLDFWRWVVGYQRVWVPRLLAAVREHAPQAELRVLRSTADVRGFLVE